MNNKITISILIILLIIIGGVFFYRQEIRDFSDTYTAEDIPPAQPRTSFNAEATEEPRQQPVEVNDDNNADPIDSEEIELPAEYNLDVPFMSQAPHANWDLPYQEACEEASLIMVDYFW
ncbi:MAG: hypothetical protein NUV82_00890, partial [Candidatus Komeilibacteria bacterium]|nr:hypothetical protein [Candidatus Komeilibacteria bacterium]